MLSPTLHRAPVPYGFLATESRVVLDPKLPVVNVPSAPSQVSAGQAETSTAVMETHEELAPAPSNSQLWIRRTSIFLFVLLSATAGVLLVILPWTPEWTDNYLLISFPWLRTFFSAGFFRGLCSGLGLLDIWIGFWEAFHYREHN